MANEFENIGGDVETILDINQRRQAELDAIDAKRQQAQEEFDLYARDIAGDPFDLNRVEAYKNSVEPWRFEQSLYTLQEDHFNAKTPEQLASSERFAPALDKYLKDNPEAFVNLDAKDNREANLSWVDREQSHHYPMFSGEARAHHENLSDNEYQMLAVAGYISEAGDIGFNNVVDNIDIFSAKYAAEHKLDSPSVSSVFNHIKGNLSERQAIRDRDKKNWSNGVSSVLNGLSYNEALAGAVDDKGGVVTNAARSSFMNEFSAELPKAKEFFDRFAEGVDRGGRFSQKMEETRDFIGIFEGIAAAIKPPKQQEDAVVELVLMPQEQRRKTLALMWMMAEDQAGELEAGFFGKSGESFMRGLESYVKNIDDAVDTTVEGLGRDADLNRMKREMHQDLRDIREVVAEIKSDSKVVQGIYDGVRSIPYQLMSFIPYANTINSLAMATDSDIQLRKLYPDMDEGDRWKIAMSAGIFQSGVERLGGKAWIKGFPSASQYLAGKGVAGKIGVLGVRGAGNLITENIEESIQSTATPLMQSIWGAFIDDIPEVSEEHKESMFLYDERTFFATLVPSLLFAGGRTAYDAIGATVANETLSDVDRVMLHGFSEQEAKAIAGETDSLKKWLMFKEGSDAKTVEERRDLSDQAADNGALDRVIKRDEEQAFQEYEAKINETGTEEDKVVLEVQKLARDYSAKYDASIEMEDDQFVVSFPDGKPSQTFETKSEADSAVKAHQIEVNESYLNALSSASANVQAMALQKKTLETKQEGAEIKLDKPIVGLKEFAEKSDENMRQALERIEHELLKTGEVRPATRADLDRWHTRGQVKLKKDARGYVARLTEGANIADLVEEGSEGFLRDLIKNGLIEEKWVKEQIMRYQDETGNKLTTSDSVDQMSYQQMVEAFSDLAVSNFYNAHQQDKTGALGSIINALRIFFAKVAKVAEDLMKLQQEGKIDADFQTLLDNSVGLGMDEQVERQTEEMQREILGEQETPSMSIGADPYKDRSGEDAGKPLTETEIREGIEDESGTLAGAEFDSDKLADDLKKLDSESFSISPRVAEGAWRMLHEDDLRGKKWFAFFADRMRVGTYTGLDPESGINVPVQGGMYYPSIQENFDNEIGWAVSNDTMFNTLAKGADETDGIGVVVAFGKGNVTGNRTFNKIYFEELRWNIKSKKISKTKALKFLNEVRKSAPIQKASQKKADTWGAKFKYNWKSTDDAESALHDATFDVRGSQFFQTKWNETKAKGRHFAGAGIGSVGRVAEGMPDIVKMVELLEDPQYENYQYGELMGAVEIKQGQQGKSMTAEEAGTVPHYSYEKVIKGKPYGLFPAGLHIENYIEPDPTSGRVLPGQALAARVSFSIGRADITPTANTRVFPTADGAVVGEASFSISAWHGTPHKVDKFRTEQIGTGEGAQAYGWGLYFAESEGVARSYRDKLSGVSPSLRPSQSKNVATWWDEARELFPNDIPRQEAFHWFNQMKSEDYTLEYFDKAQTGGKYKYSKHEFTRDEVASLAKEFFSEGSLYQVELNVEQDELLDWDKPLSEQSEVVKSFYKEQIKEALPEINKLLDELGVDKDAPISEAAPSGDISGAQLYQEFVNKNYDTFMGSVREINARMSELVKIMSDDEVAGSYREYKSDAGREAAKEYDELMERRGEILRENQSPDPYKRGGAKAASQALHAAGIKGIKYLDGDSRAEGEGTYNYVIFDDADIRITEENGKAVDTSFSIGTAQDAAYMEAVESGDMEAAQSMVDEAAKKAGYETEAWHGSSAYDGSSKKKSGLIFDVFKVRELGFHFGTEEQARERSGIKSGLKGMQKVFLKSPMGATVDTFNFSKERSRQILFAARLDPNSYFTDQDTISQLPDAEVERRHQILVNKVPNFPSHVATDKEVSIQEKNKQTDAEIKALDAFIKTDEDAAELIRSFGVETLVYSNRVEGEKVELSYVALSPAGIKSADPVTYDSDGNVVPLSQRFDPSRDEISFSLASSEDTVMERITALMRDPDAKLEVYKDMASRLNKVRERIYQKYIAYGKITDATMTESEREMDEREFIISSVAQMEAIARVLPPEVRSSLGTMKQLSTFKTGKAMRRYITSRLDKADTALEKYLRKELRADVQKLIKQSQPTGKQKADAGRSKLGDVGHRIAEAAMKAIKMSPEEAELEAQKERTKLDQIDEPTVDETQEYEDVAYAYEMFADIANADSNRLSTMKRLLKSNWDEGRKQWLGVLEKRKNWKDSKAKAIASSLSKIGKSITEKNNAGGMQSVLANAAREQLSFYNITDLLKEDMKGAGRKVVEEMTDDFRRANNASEWGQLQHKEEMKGVFSNIFGIKGINKTARVQARLNALAKGVDWGSRVTVSTMYDYKIAANAAELDQAYQQLQADPELDRVDIRDKNVSRDEFNEMYIEYQNQVAGGFAPTGRKLFRHTINRNTGERVSVGEMSQLDLLKDWLAVQQLDIKDKYDSAGHDEEYRSQLDDALDDDVKELGLWMQNKLREMTPDTERLHRSEYGLAMAIIENYFPAVFEHKINNQESRLQMDGIDVAGVSKRPSAHKMRVNHNADPKRQNAIYVFNAHVMQDIFWKTHAEVLRKWAGVLRSPDVQLAIRASKGEGFLAHVNKRLDDIETQGSAVAQVQLESDRFFRTVGKGMSLGILGMKLSTIWKNFSAISNVALGVEAKDLISGLRPEAFKEAKELLKSETFQRRLKMGASVATRYALEGGKSGNLLFSTTTRMAEVGVQGINIADTGSNLTMAIAYVAKLKKLRAENVSEADAKEQALDYIDDLMARYAQPTDRLSKSMFENSRSPLVNFLVMFQSEARKQMAINALAVRKLTRNKGAQSKSLAAQQLLVQIVGVSAFIHAVNALYGALFKGYGEGDDAEEKFINDISDKTKLASMMIGESFSGIPIVGELISGQVKRAMGQDVFSSSSNPLTRTVGAGSTQMLSVISKWDQRSASENADAILRGIQMLGSVAPQTAVLSQTSNITRDTLGFLNNALSVGLNKQDTLDIYEKRIKKVTSYVHADTKDEMKEAKDSKDRPMIRSIETQRREEIINRSRDIFLEMSEEYRREFLELQRDKENGIQKYIIRELNMID